MQNCSSNDVCGVGLHVVVSVLPCVQAGSCHCDGSDQDVICGVCPDWSPATCVGLASLVLSVHDHHCPPFPGLPPPLPGLPPGLPPPFPGLPPFSAHAGVVTTAWHVVALCLGCKHLEHKCSWLELFGHLLLGNVCGHLPQLNCGHNSMLWRDVW